jgi:hypothetical protein
LAAFACAIETTPPIVAVVAARMIAFDPPVPVSDPVNSVPLASVAGVSVPSPVIVSVVALTAPLVADAMISSPAVADPIVTLPPVATTLVPAVPLVIVASPPPVEVARTLPSVAVPKAIVAAADASASTFPFAAMPVPMIAEPLVASARTLPVA